MKLSAKIGQKFFSTQNTLQSMSDDNIDPWKRFLTKKSPFEALCKKALKVWRLMNVLFKLSFLDEPQILWDFCAIFVSQKKRTQKT